MLADYQSLRNLDRSPILVERGFRDRWVTNGQNLLNCSGGPLVQSLVNVPPAPLSALELVTPSYGVDSSFRIALEQDLLARCKIKDGGVLWATSGSDAMEVALWVLNLISNRRFREPIRTDVVRRGGYHGNTFFTRQLSTRSDVSDSRTVNGRPVHIIDEFLLNGELPRDYVPSTASRNIGSSESPLLAGLQRLFDARKISFPAALVIETMPTTGYGFSVDLTTLQDVMKWCKERNVLVLFDEIASGTYRHGWVCSFARNQDGSMLCPNIVTISKGLTAGTYPLSAVLLGPEEANEVRLQKERPPAFTYGLTEAAACLSTNCLKLYDEVAKLDLLKPRSQTLRGLALQASEMNNGHIGIEVSDNTLRIDIPRSLRGNVTNALAGAGFWAYIGNAIFPVLRGQVARSFVHICPPLNVTPCDAILTINQAYDLVSNAISDVQMIEDL